MTVDYVKPIPEPNRDSRGFWEGCRAHELRILRCRECGTYVHQPAPLCHACNASELDWQRVSGRGRVYSWVVVHHGTLPGFSRETPYVVAFIELAEQPGLRILSNVIDCDPSELCDGFEVSVTFVDAGDEVSLPVFRPAGTGE